MLTDIDELRARFSAMDVDELDVAERQLALQHAHAAGEARELLWEELCFCRFYLRHKKGLKTHDLLREG